VGHLFANWVLTNRIFFDTILVDANRQAPIGGSVPGKSASPRPPRYSVSVTALRWPFSFPHYQAPVSPLSFRVRPRWPVQCTGLSLSSAPGRRGSVSMAASRRRAKAQPGRIPLFPHYANDGFFA